MNAKIAALTLALLPALAGARDLGAGTFELSGGTNLNFGSRTYELTNPAFTGKYEVDESTVALNTDALFYVVPNLGLGLGLQYQKTEWEDDFDKWESSFSFIGPEVKYNIPVAPSVSILVGGGLGRLAMTDLDGEDADGWALTLGAGARFFVVDAVAFDATLSYLKGSVEDDFNTETDLSGWNIGLALSVFFGGR